MCYATGERETESGRVGIYTCRDTRERREREKKREPGKKCRNLDRALQRENEERECMDTLLGALTAPELEGGPGTSLHWPPGVLSTLSHSGDTWGLWGLEHSLTIPTAELRHRPR